MNSLLDGKKGDERLIKLYEIASSVQSTNIPLVNLCADEALLIIPELSDSLRIKAYKAKAFALFFSNKETEAVPLLLKGLEISRRIKSDRETGYLLNFYSVICISKGEYGKALEYLFDSISFERLKNEELRPRYTNIGLIYYKVQNTQKSIDFYRKALSVIDRGDSQYGILLINAGLSYFQFNEYSKAISYIERGLGSCKKNCARTRIQGDFALGFGNYRMKNFKASETYLNSSLALSLQTNDPRFTSENLVLLAYIYLETNRLDLAEEALRKAEKICMEFNLKELLLATYDGFISFHEERNNFSELLNYYVKYNALLEKLRGRELLQQISVFEVDMEHEANLKTIVHQKQVLSLQQESLVRQQRINYGISLLILLVAVILLLLWRRNIQRRKIKVLLEQRIVQRTEYLNNKRQLILKCNDDLIKLVQARQSKILRLAAKIQRENFHGFSQRNYDIEIRSTANRLQDLSCTVLNLHSSALY
ncbi:MAG TPA: hypothetical protein VD884_23345 [Ohtaekwangia sp.]|nr:hypothetical protein [Ohtaekwangia sp.]